MKHFLPSSLLLVLISTVTSALCYSQATVQLHMMVPESATSLDSTWLPRRHSESLGPFLERIVSHAESRKLCPQLLEARLAEGSDSSNPEFIITCKLASLQTVNLLYSAQDVEEDFRNITYEHRDAKELEPSQLILNAMGSNRVDQAKAACKRSVISNARDGDLAILPDHDAIDIRPRQDNKLAVFVKYQIGERAPRMNFTATCVVDENNLVAMEVFPH